MHAQGYNSGALAYCCAVILTAVRCVFRSSLQFRPKYFRSVTHFSDSLRTKCVVARFQPKLTGFDKFLYNLSDFKTGTRSGSLWLLHAGRSAVMKLRGEFPQVFAANTTKTQNEPDFGYFKFRSNTGMPFLFLPHILNNPGQAVA